MKKSRGLKWAGNVARMGRSAKQEFCGKTKGKRLLGRSRRKREVNAKTDLRELEWGGMGCLNLAQDRDQ
jgi:hypothetical protein